MITRTNTEMNAIAIMMIANNHYSIYGLRELVNSYNNPELSRALDCVMEEGTIDTIIEFFINNPAYYPEAQSQNNMHNHHVLTYNAILTCLYGTPDHNHLLPPQCNQPHQVYDHIFA